MFPLFCDYLTASQSDRSLLSMFPSSPIVVAPHLPEDKAPQGLVDLCIACWNFKPEQRPSLSQLIPTLEAMVSLY